MCSIQSLLWRHVCHPLAPRRSGNGGCDDTALGAPSSPLTSTQTEERTVEPKAKVWNQADINFILFYGYALGGGVRRGQHTSDCLQCSPCTSRHHQPFPVPAEECFTHLFWDDSNDSSDFLYKFDARRLAHQGVLPRVCSPPCSSGLFTRRSMGC
jgi:hypothetical protein